MHTASIAQNYIDNSRPLYHVHLSVQGQCHPTLNAVLDRSRQFTSRSGGPVQAIALDGLPRATRGGSNLRFPSLHFKCSENLARSLKIREAQWGAYRGGSGPLIAGLSGLQGVWQGPTPLGILDKNDHPEGVFRAQAPCSLQPGPLLCVQPLGSRLDSRFGAFTSRHRWIGVGLNDC